MNDFQKEEYRQYRRVAKGRHGTHSPAVYRFVVEGLRPLEHSLGMIGFISARGASWRRDALLHRIAHHFGVREIAVAEADTGQALFHAAKPKDDTSPDAVYHTLHDWTLLPPAQWLSGFQRQADRFRKDDLIMVAGIHDSPEHLAAWQALRDQPGVTRSIDLFRIGLLFFNEDFKERQHFILKYPV